MKSPGGGLDSSIQAQDPLAPKTNEAIKLLNIDMGALNPVTARVVKGIITRTLNGDIEGARSLLNARLSIDAKNPTDLGYANLSEAMIGDITSWITRVQEEQGIVPKKRQDISQIKENPESKAKEGKQKKNKGENSTDKSVKAPTQRKINERKTSRKLVKAVMEQLETAITPDIRNEQPQEVISDTIELQPMAESQSNELLAPQPLGRLEDYFEDQKPKIIDHGNGPKRLGYTSIGEEIDFTEIKPEDTSKAEELAEKERKSCLHEFEGMLVQMRRLEKIGKRNATADEKIHEWMTLSKEHKWNIESITRVDTPQDLEKREQARQAREQKILEIGEVLKQGYDRVITHGEIKEREEGGLELRFGMDLDNRAAMFLMNDVANIKHKERSIRGEYAHSAIVPKGMKSRKIDGVSLYIDTGGESLAIKKSDRGTDVFLDHHQEEYRGFRTSATALMYEVLTKNNMIEKKPWLDDLVRFVTNIDNLEYVQSKYFDENTLKHEWSRSLFALYKEVSFEQVVEWFVEERDPFKPFSDEEIKTLTATMKDMTEVPIKDLIEKKQRKVYAGITNTQFAVEQMEKNGIAKETRELGKVVFNTLDTVEGPKGPKQNGIPDPFIMIKALGYDTYAGYNSAEAKFFVNSSTHNLEGLYKRLKKVCPETKIVRGVMIVPPRTKNKREVLTKEKFLEILGLKD